MSCESEADVSEGSGASRGCVCAPALRIFHAGPAVSLEGTKLDPDQHPGLTQQLVSLSWGG